MPGQDGTGPMGQGPMTGRGLGPCGLGWRRWGQGGGRGLGRLFGWRQPQTKQDQAQALKDYLEALKEEAEDVQKKLEELK